MVRAWLWAAAAALSCSSANAQARSATLSNVIPRTDVNGTIMDIHDGVTIRIGNTFFWYGAGYGNCTEMSSGCASVEVGACGFNVNHEVNLAISDDLVNWQFMGSVLPVSSRPAGILFSPWVAQSAATGLWVLWVNILPVINGQGVFDAAYYVTATSPSPFGPFTVANPNVTGVAYTRLPDAPAIFVDPASGEGYIAFTHEDSHINHVQQLLPDLTGPLPGGGISAQIGAGNNEGIFMFARQNAGAGPDAPWTYYVGFGQCCCFCQGGTNVEIWASTSGPLGPYTTAFEVAGAADWQAQSGGVWWSGQQWILYGDRWQSAPDRIKAHDFSYWTPLTFNDSASIPAPAHISWQDNVTILF